ncbi:hypothetical protein BP6252_06823 [Coleophoma cylindrospora]|uniref:G domain-containing protein n=1 Tax=Coleophoma cylindrospora TaxID=1849047 RepID=A0A3D8RG22_9HELO|nr:hypothetical protein BP6252_06823 [Coleophoma cylindrospora]
MASSKGEILIAVLGATGAGKTTFISKATGRTDLEIGHTLQSCTQDISAVKMQLQGKSIILIDTPGFDDTYKSDAEILELIAKYLADSYANKALLSGVILLQPINANRVQGNERKRTRLFEKVCGPSAFSKVVIATTMWSDLQNESVGESRALERRNSSDFWGNMVAKGAQVARHDNNSESAKKIISMILKNPSPVTLQMQTELAQNEGKIALTSAGRQLESDLDDTSRKVLNELRDLQRQTMQNNIALQEEIRELQKKYQDAEEERKMLRRSRVSLDGKASWIGAIAGSGSLAVALIPLLACVIL